MATTSRDITFHRDLSDGEETFARLEHSAQFSFLFSSSFVYVENEREGERETTHAR